MAKKRLGLIEMDQMKDMVQRGTSPEDIANHFNIGISSVHNYKKRFKEEGLSFPNVRGQRPTGTVDNISSINKPNAQIQSLNQNDNNYKFVVNGVSIKISGEAKNVNIGKNSMEITF